MAGRVARLRSAAGEFRRRVFPAASGGLGSATARYLAARQWHVFAAGFDEAALRELAKEPNVMTIPLDVTDAASVDAARAVVAQSCDRLDGVVNFAGILAVDSVIEIDSATIRRVLEVNVMGTVRVNQALFPLVLARKGYIINISSEAGWQSGMPFNGAYAMSKQRHRGLLGFLAPRAHVSRRTGDQDPTGSHPHRDGRRHRAEVYAARRLGPTRR